MIKKLLVSSAFLVLFIISFPLSYANQNETIISQEITLNSGNPHQAIELEAESKSRIRISINAISFLDITVGILNETYYNRLDIGYYVAEEEFYLHERVQGHKESFKTKLELEGIYFVVFIMESGSDTFNSIIEKTHTSYVRYILGLTILALGLGGMVTSSVLIMKDYLNEEITLKDIKDKSKFTIKKIAKGIMKIRLFHISIVLFMIGIGTTIYLFTVAIIDLNHGFGWAMFLPAGASAFILIVFLIPFLVLTFSFRKKKEKV